MDSYEKNLQQVLQSKICCQLGVWDTNRKATENRLQKCF